jgi:hypothetical protein
LQDNPEDALEYISPMLDFALEHIPADQERKIRFDKFGKN